MDTIHAPATAQGRAGVAVIRMSGPRSWDILRDLAGGVPEPRRAVLRTLRHGGDLLDRALVICFARDASFTGEFSAELHLHGSVAVVGAVMRALSDLGSRVAEPGEFTRRALENGRLDLAQVEGLADLIDADTEAQRRQAMRLLDGAIGRRAEGWRQDLVRAAALIEATIDFSDEDVPVDVWPEVRSLLERVAADLATEIAGYGAAERVREGFEVAIVGRPNAGKSSLLNALAGREAAITSAHAGTTRDVIEVRMELQGLAVTLLDTAGLRETVDEVEGIGVQRGLARAESADLRVFLLDGGEVPMISPRPDDLLVRGKADLGFVAGQMAVSAVTGFGLAELTDEIGRRLARRVTGAGVVTRARHRDAAVRGARGIGAALAGIAAGLGAELVAEDVRSAARALESLVGRVDVEHLLDDIFASFCIGK